MDLKKYLRRRIIFFMYVHREGINAIKAIIGFILYIIYFIWILGAVDEVRFDRTTKSFYIVLPERISDANYVAKVTVISLFLYFCIRYIIKKIFRKIELYWLSIYLKFFFDLIYLEQWFIDKKEFLKNLPKKLIKKILKFLLKHILNFLKFLISYIIKKIKNVFRVL